MSAASPLTAAAVAEPAEPDAEAAARALCRSLKATAEALMEVIDAETALLKEGRPHAIEALQSDKIELSARYLGDMTRLKRQADLIRQVAGAEVEALKPVTQELGAKLLVNRDALALVLSVSERLIRTAAMTAIASRDAPATYGRDGTIGPTPTGVPAPVSVNRSL